MIHDANDTHLDGHTFAMGDTTATLSWTETSYGEKTYTKLLHGASIGTETITLTDPNTPYTRVVLTLETHSNSSFNTGTWAGSHCFAEVVSAGVNTIPTSATGIFDMYFNTLDASTGHSGQDGFSFKYENGTWSDIGVHAPVAFTNTSTYVNQTSVADGEYIYLWASSTECRARFVSPYYEAPAVPQPTLVNTISLTDGDWFPSLNYQHQATDTTNTYYEYKISGAPTNTVYFIAYNWTTRKWFDTNPTTSHNTFGTSATDTGASGATSRETAENPAIVYVMGEASNTLMASFNNPYYEPPTVVSPLPVLSQHTQAFNMEYYQTVGTKYYYKSDSHSGTGTSITYDYETKTWNDEGSQVPYHLNTTSTFASTTSLVNPAEIHAFGSQQNHNGTRYFSVSNPYYEA